MLGFAGRTILLLCVCGFAPIALAQVSAEEAARLGQDLTPVGAERAGNAEGTIPEWTGGLTEPPEGWTWEQPRVDPYEGERPPLGGLTDPVPTLARTHAADRKSVV